MNQASRGRIHVMVSAGVPCSSSQVQASIAVLPAPMITTPAGGSVEPDQLADRDEVDPVGDLERRGLGGGDPRRQVGGVDHAAANDHLGFVSGQQ